MLAWARRTRRSNESLAASALDLGQGRGQPRPRRGGCGTHPLGRASKQDTTARHVASNLCLARSSDVAARRTANLTLSIAMSMIRLCGFWKRSSLRARVHADQRSKLPYDLPPARESPPPVTEPK
jgi:hypothetical protein